MCDGMNSQTSTIKMRWIHGRLDNIINGAYTKLHPINLCAVYAMLHQGVSNISSIGHEFIKRVSRRSEAANPDPSIPFVSHGHIQHLHSSLSSRPTAEEVSESLEGARLDEAQDLPLLA